MLACSNRHGAALDRYCSTDDPNSAGRDGIGLVGLPLRARLGLASVDWKSARSPRNCVRPGATVQSGTSPLNLPALAFACARTSVVAARTHFVLIRLRFVYRRRRVVHGDNTPTMLALLFARAESSPSIHSLRGSCAPSPFTYDFLWCQNMVSGIKRKP